MLTGKTREKDNLRPSLTCARTKTQVCDAIRAGVYDGRCEGLLTRPSYARGICMFPCMSLEERAVMHPYLNIPEI